MQPGFAAVLRRLAASGREDLVLRGSVLMQVWSPVRPAEDLEMLATFPFGVDATADVLRNLCARQVGDGVVLALTGHDVIWSETKFPGIRATLEAQTAGEPAWLQVDVGFGDPQVLPPARVDVAGASVLACRAETLFGWRLHDLYERGGSAWQPKDLHDAYLLLQHANLDRSVLAKSIHIAFASRDDDVQQLTRLRDGVFGRSSLSRHKWTKFRASRPEGTVPETAEAVVQALSELLKSIWAELVGTIQ